MNPFYAFYQARHKRASVSKILDAYLLLNIYSPVVIREAFHQWDSQKEHVKNALPIDIKELIKNSPQFSDDDIRRKLNKYTIQKAVQVLKGYKKCSLPLTQDPKVNSFQYNLLSEKGKRALHILFNADKKGHYSDAITSLAIATSHKFLMDFSYYKTPEITKELAEALLIHGQAKDGKMQYAFPILKLSKGCTNNCSHCMNCAEPHVSHMPFPLWCALHKALNQYYGDPKSDRQYANTFQYFYEDNDPLSYRDDIIGADVGDIALFCKVNKAPFILTTKGATDARSEEALLKAASVLTEIVFSFVDTPKENIPENLARIQKGIRQIHALPFHREAIVDHLHLKSGPTISEDQFLGANVRSITIFAEGKACQFPSEELDPPLQGLYPVIIDPDLHICRTFARRGKPRTACIAHLLAHKSATQIADAIEYEGQREIWGRLLCGWGR